MKMYYLEDEIKYQNNDGKLYVDHITYEYIFIYNGTQIQFRSTNQNNEYSHFRLIYIGKKNSMINYDRDYNSINVDEINRPLGDFIKAVYEKK